MLFIVAAAPLWWLVSWMWVWKGIRDKMQQNRKRKRTMYTVITCMDNIKREKNKHVMSRNVFIGIFMQWVFKDMRFECFGVRSLHKWGNNVIFLCFFICLQFHFVMSWSKLIILIIVRSYLCCALTICGNFVQIEVGRSRRKWMSFWYKNMLVQHCYPLNLFMYFSSHFCPIILGDARLRLL